jgi:hypothetical protein
MNEIEGIASIVNSEVANKAYDQSLSPAAQEIGKLGGDLAKTARLLLAPLQIAALWQEKLERTLNKIKERVPTDRQIDAPSMIATTALENMKYMDEDSPLYGMFEEILLKSVDKDQIHVLHPAFIHKIKELSRDEAVILKQLKAGSFSVVDRMSLNKAENRFENRIVEKSTIPVKDLHLPDEFNLYFTHLESLNFLEWPVTKQEPIMVNGNQTGVRRHTTIHLTEWGRLFVAACIPDEKINTAM